MTNELDSKTKSTYKEDFYQLYLCAFNRTDSDDRRRFFFERYENSWIYGKIINQNLEAGLYSIPFSTNFHGTDYKMCGIGDVMSAPESSGNGYVQSLLQDALKDMYEKGVTLSYLAPFSYKFYRRCGYEHVFNLTHQTITTSPITSFHSRTKAGYVVRKPLSEVIDLVEEFYLSENKVMKGGVVRPTWWWNYLVMKNDWFTGLYYSDNDELLGYVICEREGRNLIVKEQLFANSDAFERLTEFIFNQKNTFKTISFVEPGVAHFGKWWPEVGLINTQVESYMMARIVILKDFLERYPYQNPNEEITPIKFRVTDDVLDVNSGIWSIGFSNGKKTLAHDTQDDKSVTNELTIQQLTKVLFGSSKLVDLIKYERVSFDQTDAENLQKILVNEEPEVIDYF